MHDQAIRVCFVAPYLYPVLARSTEIAWVGGAEVQQAIIARGLALRGYQVSAICLDFGQKDCEVVDGITILRAYRPEGGVPVFRFIWPRIASLWSCMSRADADVYYQRSAGMLTGLVAFFCKRRARKSIFAASGDPSLERNTDRIRYRRDRWLYEYGLRTVDRIVVQNQTQASLCRSNFLRTPVLVRSCYDLPERRLADTRHEILWVSTIRALKRPNLFLDLAKSLPQHHFTMVGGPGSGEAKLFEEIKRQAVDCSNVDFRGFVPFASIESFFDRASVFVNTSESEGFPNAFLQAWARGVPTVSFVDCGARHGAASIGRTVSSVSELSAAVGELISNNRLRAEEGARCREYVASNHSTKAVLPQYEALIKEVVGGEK